jgi:hypothetical protein
MLQMAGCPSGICPYVLNEQVRDGSYVWLPIKLVHFGKEEHLFITIVTEAFLWQAVGKLGYDASELSHSFALFCNDVSTPELASYFSIEDIKSTEKTSIENQ